jgi:carbonic anhydrase
MAVFFSRARIELERLMRVVRPFLLVACLLATGAVPGSAAPPQSPIKFENAVRRNLGVPVFGYPEEVDLDLTTLWHSAEVGLRKKPEKKKVEGIVVLPDLPTLDFRGETYRLNDLHFHSRQEHVLGNNDYPLELHLVHYHEDDQAKVDMLKDKPHLINEIRWLAAGLWIEPTVSLGGENAALSQIHADLPQAPNGPGAIDDPDGMATIDDFMLDDLVPPVPSNYFRYNGSLTTFNKNFAKDRGLSGTPVQWLFFKDPLKLTEDKISDINTLLGLADHPAMTGARDWFPMNQNRHRLAMNMAPVPEPSTLGLLAVAGLVAGLRRRR